MIGEQSTFAERQMELAMSHTEQFVEGIGIGTELFNSYYKDSTCPEINSTDSRHDLMRAVMDSCNVYLHANHGIQISDREAVQKLAAVMSGAENGFEELLRRRGNK